MIENKYTLVLYRQLESSRTLYIRVFTFKLPFIRVNRYIDELRTRTTNPDALTTIADSDRPSSCVLVLASPINTILI